MAQPDLVLISYASEQTASSPVFIWLQKHHKLFGQIVATIKKKEGKTVFHDNLLIAAIKDLSLRVLLEKKLQRFKTGCHPLGRIYLISAEFVVRNSKGRH